MVPTGLFLNQLGIQHLPAVIIEAGDKIPLLSRVGGPLVMRGVVLDELADVIGHDLPVMGFSLWSAEEKIMLLSPFDNCRNRDFLPMLLPENIPDIAVVIGVDGDIRVIDQAFLPAELMKDVLFNRRADRSGLLLSLIGDRKLRGFLTIVL